MLEEHVFITPVCGGEFTVKLEGSDQGFFTAEWKRLIGGIYVIDGGILWDEGLKLCGVSHVVVSLEFCWDQILNWSVWVESQLEWEVVSCLLTLLIVVWEIRQTNFLDVVSKSSKFVS